MARIVRSAVLTALAELSYLNVQIARGRELSEGVRRGFDTARSTDRQRARLIRK
jgi:hypothetical protein